MLAFRFSHAIFITLLAFGGASANADLPRPLLPALLSSVSSEGTSTPAHSLKEWRKLIRKEYQKNYLNEHDEIEQYLFEQTIKNIQCNNVDQKQSTKNKTSCSPPNIVSPHESRFEEYSIRRQKILPVKETELEEKARDLVRRKIKGIGKVSPVRYAIWRYPESSAHTVLQLFQNYKNQDDAVSSEIISHKVNISQTRARIHILSLSIRDTLDEIATSENKEAEQKLITKFGELIKERDFLLQQINGENYAEIQAKQNRLAQIEKSITENSDLSHSQKSNFFEEYDLLFDEIDSLKRDQNQLPPSYMLDPDRTRYFAREFAFKVSALRIQDPRNFSDLRIADILALAFIKGLITENQAKIFYSREVYQETYTTFIKRVALQALNLTRSLATAFPASAPYAILAGALYDAYRENKQNQRLSREEARIVR